ncbi:MAG TPA: hypothetical protein DF383_11525 [Deltaproteobacteria bacterium]|nr:hypothetical protein [Deltaproteobacteria bacterium]
MDAKEQGREGLEKYHYEEAAFHAKTLAGLRPSLDGLHDSELELLSPREYLQVAAELYRLADPNHPELQSIEQALASLKAKP